MHRMIVALLLAATLLIAPAASAEFYTGLRLTGMGNFCGDMELIEDSGFYTYREFVVGFGDEIQGEVSFGFNSMSLEEQIDEEEEGERRYFYDKETYSARMFGVAGFYPIQQTESFRLDGGLRFQYYSMQYTSEDAYWDDSLNTEDVAINGWAIGPVARAQWRVAGGKVAIGPEVYLKYGSYTMTQEGTYDDEPYEEEDVHISAWNVDYSLRADFYFD